jgi:hydroxymethylpyrimidine pyrophosphatase-like HAD family hydrolase
MPPLRAVYSDLDGTLLGRYGSLFNDADGEFTMLGARAVEACHRAGAELVIMSGRREAQVASDSRILGQTSYIYEAGCAVMIDGERTVLLGDFELEDGVTVYESIVARGVPDLLFASFPGKLEYHSPWHTDRIHSHLFRGKIDAAEANAILEREGHLALKLIDNGAIVRGMEGIDGPAHAYHLMPTAASKANAVAFHMRARGYSPEECIGVGDSIEDLAVADVVPRFFVPANGPEKDPGLREAIAGRPDVTVTEGRNGEGVYEAVVATLAGA